VAAPRELSGGRFQLLRKLGEGGFGVVYAAFDRERDCEVALKVLATDDAQALFRFKQEFRAIANVRHPNLVGLQELFAEGNMWFFTMELVTGVRFGDWVRQRDPRVFSDSTQKRVESATVKLSDSADTADDLPELDATRIDEHEGRLDVE